MPAGKSVARHLRSSLSCPLVVDLDGTLVRTDLLVEGIVALIKQAPGAVFRIPVWLFRGGRAGLKAQIARRVRLDPTLLPYNARVQALIKGARDEGRPVILATAAHVDMARPIADHVGGFDLLIASTEDVNNSGDRKVSALREAIGDGPFDYVGNSRDDLPVWTRCQGIHVVEPALGVLPALARLHRTPETVFHAETKPAGAFLRVVRPHQWLKNSLVFVPLIAAHVWSDPFAWRAAFTLFIAFCLTASSVYLANDLLDLNSDRLHVRKRRRPFASGDLPLVYGLAVSPVLLIVGFMTAWLVSVQSLVTILGYAILTTAYSFRLKRVVILDVVLLAGLYTARVMAGAVAISVTPSFWLLAFAVFFFLGLATMKRAAELKALEALGQGATRGRGYRVGDLPTVRSLGITSGYLSVLVLALFIHAPDIQQRYKAPELLWVIGILLLYWVGRAWIKVERGDMHDDPLVFAATDRVSWWVVVLSGASLLASSFGV